jgi:hypothetical protein
MWMCNPIVQLLKTRVKSRKVESLHALKRHNCPTGAQTAFDWIGFLIQQRLNEAGKPVGHGDLSA